MEGCGSHNVNDYRARVTQNAKLTERIFWMTFEAPELARSVRAGQCLMVFTPDGAKLLGRPFEAADASLELLMRRVCQNLKPPFEIPAFRVYMDETSDGIKSEASIKVRDRNGSTEHTAADGDGPVDALSNALKKALSKFFPVMERMRLIDYKVRVLDEKAATAAPVRVIIRSTDGESQWSTVGVSTNVIEASLTALTDSVEYGIYINRE